MGPPGPYVGATNEAGKEGGKGKQSCDVANPTSPIPTDQSLLLFLTNPRQKQKSVNSLFIDCSPGVKVFFWMSCGCSFVVGLLITRPRSQPRDSLAIAAARLRRSVTASGLSTAARASSRG